jgi:hypothetical protein
MQTTRSQVRDAAGATIPGSRALLWGNNASWLCVKAECGALLGNRTADGEHLVTCDGCGARYEILRTHKKNGTLNLGPAVGVRQLLVGTTLSAASQGTTAQREV